MKLNNRPGGLRKKTRPYEPHMPVLARIIIGSRAFQRLMDRLDTREGKRLDDTPAAQQPSPSRSSERLLPEKGPFAPRMHPLGGMVFRTRFVRRLLGNPLTRTNAGGPNIIKATGEEGNGDIGEDRSSCAILKHSGGALTDNDLRDLRQNALISCMLHSASRWGAR
ncbi:hypothetical protein [Ciceribacter naphthalenivorans]|uniref:hypothetical protein n=1 Tax=Ciceribacter naphthalenivorans TaxID=1118451 RepID=UPI0011BE0037|nr:hypothetical protein [Ciceribacter naphthalenivorans]